MSALAIATIVIGSLLALDRLRRIANALERIAGELETQRKRTEDLDRQFEAAAARRAEATG